MALQIREKGSWSDMRYLLSFAPVDSGLLKAGVTDGRSLLQPGSVYVLPPYGFEQMPTYRWPGLGDVLEPHWVSTQSVESVMRVPVSPDDFPLPVRIHNAARVDALSRSDPWRFPWLEPETR